MTEYHTDWTIDDYLDKVLEQYELNPAWRIGQTHSNVLWEFRKDLSDIVPLEIEPYTDDRNVPNYMLWLRENWTK